MTERLMLDEISFEDKKIKLVRPIILDINVERGIRYDIYILSNEDLKLFAMQKSLKESSAEIQEEFCELWEEYVECPESDLTEKAMELKKKLMSYTM